MDDLLDGRDRDPRLLRERAERLHADLDATHVVLAARLESTGDAEQEAAARRRLWSAANHLAATRHGLAAARDGGTVLLLPAHTTAASELASHVAGRLSEAIHESVTVGASAPVEGLAGWTERAAAAYVEAQRCLDALRLLGRSGQGAAAEDFGFLGLLLADSRDVGGFVARTIGEVITYDERRGTDLLRTLDAYFASGMSPARTKDALHVHVNTVAQRLEQVGGSSARTGRRRSARWRSNWRCGCTGWRPRT